MIPQPAGGAGSDLDPQAADRLLVELRPLVVRTVRLVVGAGSVVADDAAQEALLEISRSVAKLNDVAAAAAWAIQIATRVALRTAKRERRLSLIGLRAAHAPEGVAANPSPDLLELKDAFDQLPPRLRATAVLRLYVGFSEVETAAALGCSVGTVKSQLHEARRRLSKQLRESPRPPVPRAVTRDCPEGG